MSVLAPLANCRSTTLGLTVGAAALPSASCRLLWVVCDADYLIGGADGVASFPIAAGVMFGPIYTPNLNNVCAAADSGTATLNIFYQG